VTLHWLQIEWRIWINNFQYEFVYETQKFEFPFSNFKFQISNLSLVGLESCGSLAIPSKSELIWFENSNFIFFQIWILNSVLIFFAKTEYSTMVHSTRIDKKLEFEILISIFNSVSVIERLMFKN